MIFVGNIEVVAAVVYFQELGSLVRMKPIMKV
jgi:hypothetical protein